MNEEEFGEINTDEVLDYLIKHYPTRVRAAIKYGENSTELILNILKQFEQPTNEISPYLGEAKND